MVRSFDRDGFAILPAVLSGTEIETLRTALRTLDVAPGHRRLMERVPEIAALAVSPAIRDRLRDLAEGTPLPVRSIFFDKTPEANWLVPWHQDLTIAVQEKRDVPGYGPWSVKDGVPHVQPPAELLDRIITLRLHLDDCGEDNGALRVIPGSHRAGRCSAGRIATLCAEKRETTCAVLAGDALVMRPLLLHASSAATVPSHRRVIHLEYATMDLPAGLAWAEQVRN